jgi:hypothetical protein
VSIIIAYIQKENTYEKMNKISKKIVENYNLLKLRREFNIVNAISRFNTYQKHDRERLEMYYDPKFTYKDVKNKVHSRHNRNKAENKKRKNEKHAANEWSEETEYDEKLIYAIQCKNLYCILSDLEKNYENVNEHALITVASEKENGTGLENSKSLTCDLNKWDELIDFGKKNVWIIFMYLDLISHINKMNLDLSERTPSKIADYKNDNSNSTPLTSINPNQLYIKNTWLKPSSLGGVLAELEESRSFNLKRKGTSDESASDPEQTITEKSFSEDIVCAG